VDDIKGFLIPVMELLGVIVLAVGLVSLLVGGLVLALKRLAATRFFTSYRLQVALRILVGFHGDTRKGWRRLIPVSGQNFIAMVGSAIGVWALIVVLSVMGGFESDLKGKIVRHSPHLSVEPILDLETASGDASRVDSLASRLAGIPHAVASEAYFEGEAMVTSPTNMSPGMIVRGVPAGGALEALWLAPSTTQDALTALANPVIVMNDRELGLATVAGSRAGLRGDALPSKSAGVPSEAEDPTGQDEASSQDDAAEAMPGIPDRQGGAGRLHPGMILGEELARSLGTGTGDEVIAVVPDGDVGPAGVRPRTRTYRVVGTFASGMYEYDLKTAYVTLDEAQALFLQGSPNRVAVMLTDIDRLDVAAAEARTILASSTGGEVRTVAQANKSLFSALLIEKIAMFLVLGLVILVAAFNVFGSLVLITMEKTRDVAVLRCLGATRGGVRSIFLGLGAVIGSVGTLAGLLLGLGTCAYIAWTGIRLPAEYYLRTLPVEVRPLEVTLVVLAALGAGMLATIYPAQAVANLSPSEGLRND
jgi:lipoprotein-releasing system permease protein